MVLIAEKTTFGKHGWADKRREWWESSRSEMGGAGELMGNKNRRAGDTYRHGAFVFDSRHGFNKLRCFFSSFFLTLSVNGVEILHYT